MLPDHLTRLDATALLEALHSGQVTAADATRAYLDRIETLNPQLHAVITVNPDAARDAAALDARPAEHRGPLHGLPMLIKDIIDVAGLPTTAGSVLLRDHVPTADAPLVARLRAAGAVILGKANMTEWANFMTLGMTNGYSSLGGQTVNPWRAGRDTGGSSSGSGVAVAARLCAAAIGTETSGSIVSPAHQSGVYGLKPTLGLVPRTGIIPISHSQDTAGPITRSARDADLILRVISGPDPADPATQALTLTAPAASGPLRAVLIDDARHASPGELAALDTVAGHLGRLGADVQRRGFPSREELSRSGWLLDVLVYEFKGDLNAYLSGVQRGPRSLHEVIQANDADQARCLKYGQTLLHAAEGTRGDFSEQAYRQARDRDLRLTRTEGFDVLFQDADLVVFPGIHGYDLAAKAGYPSLAVPTLHDGEPTGVLLVAPHGQDRTLLQFAAALQGELGDPQLPPV
jgi:amidase